MMHALSILAVAVFSAQGTPHRTWLSDVRPLQATQSWGELKIDEGIESPSLSIAGRTFKHGLGTHANSSIVFAVRKGYERFQAWVGVDGAVAKYKDSPQWKGGQHPCIIFRVFADGKKVFDSGTMVVETPAKRVDVSLAGVEKLQLTVDAGMEGNYGDWSDWCDPVLIGAGPASALPSDRRQAFSVRARGLEVDLSKSGAIVGLRLGAKKVFREALGFSEPAGLPVAGPAAVRTLSRGAVEFAKKLKGGGSLVERFTPIGESVRWTVELQTLGKPWSAPVETSLVWPHSERCKVWTAWGNDAEWTDPLEPKAFKRMDIGYGALFDRRGGSALPMVTVLDGDLGFSLFQSPEDKLVDMQIQVDRDGKLTFSRINQRLGGGRKWRFSVDLVAHEADPKSALAWFVGRYPKLFNPPNPLADEIGGGGAYSGDESDLDPMKFKQMGLTFNWKASIDFPYMGMFIPPVANDVKWNKFAGGGGGGYGPGDEGRYGQTSVAQMEDYSRRMRRAGFYVLSYFNVTEFGGNIDFPAPKPTITDPAQLWRNPDDFLYGSFPEAILRMPDKPLGTWGGAVILDCGEKRYQDFLIRQAERHIKDLPDASGICIDRMDWLVQYNPHADDGLSWLDGPTRHLCFSWQQIMNRLGPLMHKANKVIFVNAMTHRIELMEHVDGVYDEHGESGFSLNRSAFLCLRKPNVAWTSENAPLKTSPDPYVQRHLYLGAFMTVPLPGNDHTILLTPAVERVYMDYGPMFNALRGRKWVLLPHVVTTSVGKANVFSTPNGFVVPIVFGGSSPSAKVVLKGLLRGLRPEVLHPGEKEFVPLSATDRHGRLELTVPLVRGCAVVRLRQTGIGLLTAP